MPTDNSTCYRERERKKRERAGCCADSSARLIHLELAHRYASLVDNSRAEKTAQPEAHGLLQQ